MILGQEVKGEGVSQDSNQEGSPLARVLLGEAIPLQRALA